MINEQMALKAGLALLTFKQDLNQRRNEGTIPSGEYTGQFISLLNDYLAEDAEDLNDVILNSIAIINSIVELFGIVLRNPLPQQTSGAEVLEMLGQCIYAIDTL